VLYLNNLKSLNRQASLGAPLLKLHIILSGLRRLSWITFIFRLLSSPLQCLLNKAFGVHFDIRSI
jgi:hypothetical protein